MDSGLWVYPHGRRPIVVRAYKGIKGIAQCACLRGSIGAWAGIRICGLAHCRKFVGLAPQPILG